MDGDGGLPVRGQFYVGPDAIVAGVFKRIPGRN